MAGNPYNKYIKQYQANNVSTATPEKLMLMLFDAAIQNLIKAKNAIEEKNYLERTKNLENARNILREFQRSIDLENGNDVSKSLFTLYNRMATKLIQANVKKDIALIDEVLEDFNNLRWAFGKAVDIEKGLITVEQALEEDNLNNAINVSTNNIVDSVVNSNNLEVE